MLERRQGKLRKIEALVFDMDGLLFDSEKVVQRSWNLTGEGLGIGKVGEHIYHTLGMNLKGRMEYFLSVYGPDFPVEAFDEGTKVHFDKIAKEEGVPLKPGVKELLEYGRRHGYKMAVATSSRRPYSENILKAGGIYGYFDGIVFGDMVSHSKPDPEIYLSACKLIGADPKRSMAFEDAPNGVRSAYAAGMYTVMVPDMVEPTEEIRKLTFRVLSTLNDAVKLLEEM